MVESNLEEILISQDTNLLECYRLLDKTGYRMLVCVEQQKLIGVVTDSDIRRGIVSGLRLEDKVEPTINRNPVVATPEMSEKAMLALMKKKDVDPIPVIDKAGRLVDMYSMHHLLKSTVLPNSAIIMAGGLGKRLMPLTKDVPKPLLKIGDKPIIEHVISHIADHGIENVFITVNYKSQMVEDYLGDGKQLGVKIEYLREEKQLGTVGAISLLRDRKIEFPFIITNGDILTRIDVRKLLDAHDTNGSGMTVCLKSFHYDVPYGVVNVNGNRLVNFDEKPQYNFLINTGIYCMSPELMSFIPYNEYYDANMLVNLLLSKNIPVGSFIIDEYWRDIGNIEDFYGANNDYRNGNLD